MTNSDNLQPALEGILATYQTSFTEKRYKPENIDDDLLMNVFGLTPELKRENRQYWGRELGMCWQRLIIEICKHTREDYRSALRFGADEPCDLIVGHQAIDTKYRIGSGDSGTLKKFKAYGSLLKQEGYEPVLLIIREDNLPAAITACNVGGWNIYTSNTTYKYVQELTGFDIKSFLEERTLKYLVRR